MGIVFQRGDHRSFGTPIATELMDERERLDARDQLLKVPTHPHGLNGNHLSEDRRKGHHDSPFSEPLQPQLDPDEQRHILAI